jgi:hypothetical protein
MPQVRVGSRRDDDLVLAVGVHDDQGNPGRPALTQDRLDPGLAQAGEGFLGELVVANAADERHLGAHPRRGYGLVRPLPARKAVEGGIGERLPRSRQPLATRHEVKVDRADYRQLRRQLP